ncbi:MAG: serine/threonine-protein phosphatase [Spirochaetes bacterium]|nr:serine/threonine-protein phosphatase [Spirochaetota bacterium]
METEASYLGDIVLNSRNISLDELYERVEMEHGRRLAKLFYYEWELVTLREEVIGQEREHGRALALLFENESQKMQLQELNRRLSEAAVIHEKDLKMAENVQRSLLIDSPPATVNYEIAYHYEPYSSVSGDFYDFYIDENKNLTGMALVDVSGHGIASGLLTVLTKPIFFRTFQKYSDQPIEKIVEYTNTNLIYQIRASEYYLTAIILRFVGDTVEYVNAAHPDVLVRKAATGRCFPIKPEEKPAQGAVLGVEAMNYTYEPLKFTLQKDDVILLYTDCLSETKNLRGAEYGQERVVELVERCPVNAKASEILEQVLSDFRLYTGNKKLMDDLSIIVLKKK